MSSLWPHGYYFFTQDPHLYAETSVYIYTGTMQQKPSTEHSCSQIVAAEHIAKVELLICVENNCAARGSDAK